MKITFNELANNSGIRLLKGTKNSVLNIAESISNGKNLRIKPIYSSLKNQCIAYNFELIFS